MGCIVCPTEHIIKQVLVIIEVCSAAQHAKAQSEIFAFATLKGETSVNRRRGAFASNIRSPD
jgi:hypothetical protein